MKLLQRHVAVDIRSYIDENKFLNPFQSAYRPHHSTETALVRIHDDIMQALDRRKGVILVLCYLTAAADTVDHSIPLKRMKSIGTCESALAWIASYLSDRTLVLRLRMTFLADNKCGVLQGSVLGPKLLTIYCIFATNHLKYHMYADDTQLYVDFPQNQPCYAEIVIRRIEGCTTDIKRWMKSHQLLLNETKTETIVFYARSARVPHATTAVDMCRCHVTPQPTIRDIGIFLDSGMDMSMQV